MKLSGKECVLVLRSPGSAPKKIEFASSLSSALSTWAGRDRISPLFEIWGVAWNADFVASSGEAHLIFVGPVPPHLVDDCLPVLNSAKDRAWLTYGLYNLAVYTVSAHRRKRLLKWVDGNHLRYEAWQLRNGQIIAVDRDAGAAEENRPQILLDGLASFQLRSSIPELRDAAEEYCALLAASACRSSEVDPRIADELQQANNIIASLAIDYAGQSTGSLSAIALLVDANAALSRFTSQAFSGFPPILETECHFWTHSLLGTGIANLALMKIRRFITQTLGEARIPEQVEVLRSITDSQVLKELLDDGPIWNDSWLQMLPAMTKTPVLEEPLPALCPLITYLSGRDGFHTTQVSLSAPLSILTSCNSSRWSLLTITHEMSHRVVDEALGYILPDPSNDREVEQSAKLLNEEREPANVLECLQLKLLDTMAKLNASTPLIEPQDAVTPSHIIDLIGTRREEVEEVMVHVFDFIYFYGAEPEAYVPAIWRSWDAIPSLHRRLPAYVLRTLCAVYSKYWASLTPTQDAITAVTAGMEVVAKNDKDNAYIDDALQYLRDNREFLQKQMRRRRTLVGLVRTFLQSPVILQAVRGQATETTRKQDLTLDGASIENPLRFIEAHTTSADSSVLRSFVLLNRLAFDTLDSPPLRIEGIHK